MQLLDGHCRVLCARASYRVVRRSHCHRSLVWYDALHDCLSFVTLPPASAVVGGDSEESTETVPSPAQEQALGSSGLIAIVSVGAVLLVAVGVPICDAGGRHFNKKDPGVVVWDEIATAPLVFLFVPKITLGILLVGFFLHRLFDILKPPPCRQLEKLPGGLGIMADDVGAGLYALAVMHGLLWFRLLGA